MTYKQMRERESSERKTLREREGERQKGEAKS